MILAEANMDLHIVFFELMPAISVVYEIGFLPEEGEICELSPELYSQCRSKGNNIAGRLYTVIPKSASACFKENEIGLLSEADIPKLRNAVGFLRDYAKKAGCESVNGDDVLAAAAKILPPVFSKNSRFAQNEEKESY